MNAKVKNFLHKFFKIFLIFIIAGLVINLGIILFVYINHKNKLDEERALLVVPGQLVDVEGSKLHVYTDGPDEPLATLVFMHSSNTQDDSIALAPLMGHLSDKYRVVFIERSGYGFSEVSKRDRDIDTILSDTRKALEKLSVKGPYVLVPSGTAGLEALHWANCYPDEVSYIVGMNMYTAEDFDGITEEEYCGFFNYVLVYFSKVGGHRFVKSIYPEDSFAVYSERQMLARKAIISKNYYSLDMYNEELATIDNAHKVKQEGWPEDTGMTFILSNPLLEPYINEDADARAEYEEAKKENPDFDFVSAYNEKAIGRLTQHEKVQTIEMAGPARLYTYNPVLLAEIIDEILQDNLLQ